MPILPEPATPLREHAEQLMADEARLLALVAHADQCRVDASTCDDPDEALGLLEDARAATARATAIREGRA